MHTSTATLIQVHDETFRAFIAAVSSGRDAAAVELARRVQTLRSLLSERGIGVQS